MWAFQHTETTEATPAQLWAWYAEPRTWPRWDSAVAAVTMNEPLVSGARGVLKPATGPRASFVVTEVTPYATFTTVSRLPLARLALVHLIEPVPSGSRLTHRVVITGPLAPLFARVIGRGIAVSLPPAMRSLIGLAEAPTVAVTYDDAR